MRRHRSLPRKAYSALPHAGRCGATNKRCFKSEQDAHTKINRDVTIPMRAYKCQFCGYWHLSSKV